MPSEALLNLGLLCGGVGSLLLLAVAAADDIQYAQRKRERDE